MESLFDFESFEKDQESAVRVGEESGAGRLGTNFEDGDEWDLEDILC